MRTLLLLALATLDLVSANPNGLGRLPPRGWNTWCTGASCDQPATALEFPASGLHDNCSVRDLPPRWSPSHLNL